MGLKLIKSGSCSLWYMWIVKCLVSSVIFFGWWWSVGKWIMLNVSWFSKFVWNVFCWVICGKFVLVVYIKCIFVFNIWLLLICLYWLYLIMCSSFFCIESGVVVNLFKNSVLFLVCLKCFWWCFLVLVNEFDLWLNSFELISFLLSVE